MTPFEEQLKKALTREEPSADFSSRVLSRIPRSNTAQGVWGTWRLAVAALLALLVAGGTVYQRHERQLEAQRTRLRATSQERNSLSLWVARLTPRPSCASCSKGEAAKEKLLIAMRIAGAKLQVAQEQVERVERVNQ